MEQSAEIQNLRNAVRDVLGESPIYTDSISAICDVIRQDVPGVTLADGAGFALSVCLFLLSVECRSVCVHDVAREIAALADRILMDMELAERVNL
jgi:hypothetical protein